MISNRTVWAIIPARAGSKRFPGKNLALYKGKSLIQHAIDHAATSKYIDEIILNSESAEIRNSVPPQPGLILHRRPYYLASDSATSEAVIAECLYHRAVIPDLFVLLQTTSPLRSAADIDRCIEGALEAGCAISVSSATGAPNGAVYACRSIPFLELLKWPVAALYPMPAELSVDIDLESQLQAIQGT